MSNQNTPQDDKTAKILDKIKKLMKLQQSSEKIGNEHEAAQAARAIQRLLTEYNLSMDSIGDPNAEDRKNMVTEDRDMSWFVPTIGGQWKVKLAVTIASFNFCKILITNSRARTFMIVGTPQNIETCKYLIELLTDRFVKIGKDYFKDYKNRMEYVLNPISYDAYMRRFCEGAIIGLHHKLRDEARDIRKEYGEERVTSLVVVNDKDIAEYMAEKYPVVGKVKNASHYKNDNIKAKGYQTGRNTSLSSGAITKPSDNLALGK